jgi:hypothetical protein
MALETVNGIKDLDWNNPTEDDSVGEGNEHLKNIKRALLRDAAVFDTVAEAQAATNLVVGGQIRIKERANAVFDVVTDETADGYAIISLSSGLFGKMSHDGTASVAQVGIPYSETQTSLGTAIQSLVSVGVKNIIIDNPDVTISGTIDLQGANVFGKATVYSGGSLVNGQQHGIRRATLGKKFVEKTDDIPIQVSKERVKALIKVASTPNGVSSPNGEDYCILSPSSFGGIAMFFLQNGTGTTASGNLGAPFDRLRPVNTYLASGGITIIDTPTSTTGTITPRTYELLDNYYGTGVTVRWASTGSTSVTADEMTAGATATFNLPGNKRKSNVVFFTSATSSADCTITVNGQVVKTFSAASTTGNTVGVVEFELPRAGASENTIVINAGSSRLYLFGIDFYELGNLQATDDSFGTIYKLKNRYIVHTYDELTYSGTGASIDSVFLSGDVKFCGSYHGGDLADNAGVDIRVDGTKLVRCKTSAYTEANTALTLSVGESYTGRSVRVRYKGTVQSTPPLPVRMTWDFGVDGGCRLTGWYSASSDTPFLTIYTGMHSTSRDLLNTPWKTYSATATEATEEIAEDLNLVQYSSDNRHIAIFPSKTTSDNCRSLGKMWDSGSYLKYYYTPIDLPSSVGGLVLKSGETFEFSCLYQYGRAIV